MKLICIPEPNSWRPEPGVLYHFGLYRVPEDMSDELAQRAVAEGAAQEVETKPAPPVAATKAMKGKL